MKYYKIVLNNTIIGVINSDNFIRYQTVKKLFIGADENTGDFIEYNNKIYRSLWMKPLSEGISIAYTIVDVIEITYEVYLAYLKAKLKDEIIVDDEPEPEPIAPPVNTEDPDIMLEYIRSSKLSEMSYTCRMTIEAGFDLELRNETHHFSLDTQDQLNLISLSAMAQTQELIPYHADGESCIFYTAEEINLIVAAATSFKIYQTTYYNALKGYINALDTIEEISAITYGTPIPEEYKSDVLRALEQ